MPVHYAHHDGTVTATEQPLSGTPRTRLGRKRDRAVVDRAALAEVLRAGFVCHLGFVQDGVPVVLPTSYAVDLGPQAPDANGTLYLHGSVASRSLLAAPEQTVCVTVTHVDGLVLARSGFDSSMNYRSAVVFGHPRVLVDAEKRRALDLLVDHLVPGRAAAVRAMTRKDLAATTVLAMPLTEASLKVRDGGVNEEPEDAELPIWAGVVPLRIAAGAPEPSPDCALPVPEHVTDRVRDLRPPA